MSAVFMIWVILSIFGISLMYIDKSSAIKKKKRISEKTLILVALSGGALAMWLTMYTIHHKTRHLKFTILFPLFSVLHLSLFYFLALK